MNPKNIKIITDNLKSQQLSFVFYRLFFHFYPYPEKVQREIYKPQYILNVIASKNKIYKTNSKRNPNELLNFILNTLHEELNINKNQSTNININIYDKNNVIYNSIQNYINNNNSIIFNLVNWFEIKETTCLTCSTQTYFLYTFNTFELDILGTYIYKKNPININDCLEFHNIQKQQNLYCNVCHKYNQVLNKTIIYSSPNNFIFSLDRKNLEQKMMQIPFIVSENLKLSSFIENTNSPIHYQLIGILSYYLNEKKYISFCVSPVDKQWYVYNDEKVSSININTILNFHNSNIKLIPCILVYKSIHQNFDLIA